MQVLHFLDSMLLYEVQSSDVSMYVMMECMQQALMYVLECMQQAGITYIWDVCVLQGGIHTQAGVNFSVVYPLEQGYILYLIWHCVHRHCLAAITFIIVHASQLTINGRLLLMMVHTLKTRIHLLGVMQHFHIIMHSILTADLAKKFPKFQRIEESLIETLSCRTTCSHSRAHSP